MARGGRTSSSWRSWCYSGFLVVHSGIFVTSLRPGLLGSGYSFISLPIVPTSMLCPCV